MHIFVSRFEGHRLGFIKSIPSLAPPRCRISAASLAHSSDPSSSKYSVILGSAKPIFAVT